jgi:AbrB family looped-hinge helix DNA binding protein
MKFLGSAKVTSRGQVVIPKEVREKFKIKEGDFVLFYDENGKLIIKKG